MGTELEWKLAVPEPALLEELLAWEELRRLTAEPLRHYHMRTTYFDTPERLLTRRRLTLRRRMENERSVICCKAPLGAEDSHLRGEWEVEGDELAAALPRLPARGAPALLTELGELRPICGADFHRRAVLLRLDDGSACELALDAGRLFGPTESLPLCEAELELKEGAPDASLALLARLTERFGLAPQPLSKFARARALG